MIIARTDMVEYGISRSDSDHNFRGYRIFYRLQSLCRIGRFNTIYRDTCFRNNPSNRFLHIQKVARGQWWISYANA